MKDNEKLSGCLMLFICGMGIFFAQTPLNTQYKLIIEPTLNPTRSVSQEIQLSGVTVQEAENNRGQLEADIAASQGRADEDVEITSISSSGTRRFRKLLAQKHINRLHCEINRRELCRSRKYHEFKVICTRFSYKNCSDSRKRT